MRSPRSRRRTAPAFATSEDYIPGLAPPDGDVEAPTLEPDPASPGWWVKRSALQRTDAAGHPAGFQHQLMHGSKTINTGFGADCARTFRQQADFMNAKNQAPLVKSHGDASRLV